MASLKVRYSRGVWVVDISEYIAGKRVRSIKTFGKGRAAELEARAFETDQRQQADTGSFRSRQTMTFGVLWRKFEEHELIGTEPGPATVADYKSMARNYLLPEFENVLLKSIDSDRLMTYKAKLLTVSGVKASGKEGTRKPLSARTVAKILTLAGTVFRYGKRINVLADNPMSEVKKPKAGKRTVYILEPDEIGRLRGSFDVEEEQLMVELDITTGLRSAELRGLTWPMVDLQGARIHIVTQASRRRADDVTKTQSSIRTIPIPSYLIPVLRRWKLRCPPSGLDLVFPGPANAQGERGPIDADKLLRNVLRRALSKAGLPPIRFHDLRHLAGSLMSEAGVPPKRAQEILGHADIRTTLAIYTHTMKRKHDDSADRMAAFAGLAPMDDVGDKRDTNDDLESAEVVVSHCINGSPGEIRTPDQRINRDTALFPSVAGRDKSKT